MFQRLRLVEGGVNRCSRQIHRISLLAIPAGLRPVPDAATLKNPPTVHFATMTGAFAGAGRLRLPYRSPLF
ncbi:hypothetical protein JTL80_34750, partial [Pseudomonas aeruginosa]|nr:hypothetical protein [Pseudomonas aeruginosa]